MVSVAAGKGAMYTSCEMTQVGGASLSARSSCNSFCSLLFSSVKSLQHLFSASQSTSVCFSFVLHVHSSHNR
jgi:hypothetical protein